MMRKIFLFIITGTLFISCENAFFDEQPVNTPQENFDHFWVYAYQTYSFFEYKNIEWESIKTEYQSKIYDSMSDDSLFSVLAEMTSLLKDGHSSLYSALRTYKYNFFLQDSSNFDYYLLLKYYLEPNNYEDIDPFKIAAIGNIGYIYYESFADEFTGSQLDYILTKFSDKKGIILDIRNNTGGDSGLIDLLAGRFTDKKKLVGYLQFKNGPGINDFTDKISCYVHPNGENRYTGKVILLTNRKVYSSANFATAFFDALPNATIIGDTTGGGGGIPSYTELPNGWIFRCSSSILTTPDGFITENGIGPDILESLHSAGINKDGILERAIVELNK